jgi:peptide methionine sulfoxide reductase MsrB
VWLTGWLAGWLAGWLTKPGPLPERMLSLWVARSRASNLRSVLLPLLALLTSPSGPAAVTAPRPSALPICDGPVQPELLFGCTKDHAMAEQICCRNRHHAEPSGYQEQSHVNLFPKLKTAMRTQQDGGSGVTTFYDSVCGKPLFRAPVGRSFEEWAAESLEHGWPSFRDAEVIKENIVVDKSDGEVRSACGLHLGHNIPDRQGDRYCIDLVCIAGKPEAELPVKGSKASEL